MPSWGHLGFLKVKVTPKMNRRQPRMPKMFQEVLKKTPRWPKMTPRWPQEAPRITVPGGGSKSRPRGREHKGGERVEVVQYNKGSSRSSTAYNKGSNRSSTAAQTEYISQPGCPQGGWRIYVYPCMCKMLGGAFVGMLIAVWRKV